ncbi:MAG: DUF47 family protein [Candidatus Brocadiia bacterium]
MGLKEWLVPQDKVFFMLLEEHASVQIEAAEFLKVAINSPGKMNEHALRMKEIEHHGDSVVHSIIVQLNKSFITPMEHDDIANLARTADDVVDSINGAISRMNLFEAQDFPPEIASLADVILRATIETKGAITGLRDIKNSKEISRHCVEINRLENVADELAQRAIAALYKKGDVMQILKFKEIIDLLERSTDFSEDVAHLISNIVVKNA